jgi:periplasmic divalent cation tolerance protein
MKSGKSFLLVLVTVPDLKTARRLVKGALAARLIACANLVPGIESHYWWRDKIESASEVLIVLKTTPSRVASLERFILSNHPYDTPEIIALPLAAGTERYLEWILASLGKSVRQTGR